MNREACRGGFLRDFITLFADESMLLQKQSALLVWKAAILEGR